MARAHPALGLEYSLEKERDFRLRTIGSLRIINRRGAIRVRGWTLDKVRVRAVSLVDAGSQADADRLLSTAGFDYRERSGRIELEAQYGLGLDMRERLQERRDPRVRMDLEIMAPSGVSLEVWSVEGAVTIDAWRAPVSIRDTNGQVTLHGVNGRMISVTCADCGVTGDSIRGELRVSGGAGAVRLKDVSGPELYVKTTSGEIEVRAAKAKTWLVSDTGHITGSELTGQVEFETRKGNVDVVKVNGQLTGRTTTGHMRLEVQRWDPVDRAFLESEKGNIELTLPANLSTELEVRSGEGDARVEFPL
ncbi:MAG TPA: DUF4097 family beta strand repeat-containing protein, partial [Bdellovibrionota bacterium]|nr:DUF4097 family beta strand repeat-containing protein [Bdellovibrionota bacterium]